MARSCGVELVLLILLGFAVGVLTYLYTGTKSDLDNVQKANQMLKQKVMESDSNTKTSLYKKNLAESTLKSLKEENKELQDRLAEQNLELKDMESRLAQTKLEYSKAMKNITKLSMAREEMEGIEDHIVEQVKNCEDKLKKCDSKKNSSLKSASLASARKVKALEDVKRKLSEALESQRLRTKKADERAQNCESRLPNTNPDNVEVAVAD